MKSRCAFVALGALALLSSLAGCKAKPATDANQPAEPASPPATPLSMSGVSGVVSFAGTPPPRIPIDTTMDPACSPPGAAPVLTEQYVVANGKLANVFVYIKSGPPAATNVAARPAPPAVLDQVHCQYTPHVIAIATGGSVLFKNADDTMHNIHTMPVSVGNDTVDISQGPHGTPVIRQFKTAEIMMPVRCNNHPWMSAFLNISPTPFFAVSDATGRFAVRGLPPGDYVLTAVHEKLGERDIHVTIKPDTTTQADFLYTAR